MYVFSAQSCHPRHLFVETPYIFSSQSFFWALSSAKSSLHWSWNFAFDTFGSMHFFACPRVLNEYGHGSLTRGGFHSGHANILDLKHHLNTNFFISNLWPETLSLIVVPHGISLFFYNNLKLQNQPQRALRRRLKNTSLCVRYKKRKIKIKLYVKTYMFCFG